MEETTTYGSVILTTLKEQLSKKVMWRDLEPQLAVYCSRIPQTNTKEGKEKVVQTLKEIKQYLIIERINPELLSFLDEEIDRYDQTMQILKYDDKDETLNPELIKKYASLTNDEGVVGIHLGLNYEQLKKLTNGVYSLTKLIKFYISPEVTLSGKITNEIFEHPQDIPVATLAQTKKEDKNKGIETAIFLFGEKIEKKDWIKIKEIKIPFYIYNFVTDKNQEFVLLTMDQQLTGDYIIRGVYTEVEDFKSISESSKIPTKLPYFFVQTIKNRITLFKDRDEYIERINQLNISKKNLFNHIFCINRDGKDVIMKHPTWFKYMVWSWVLHAKYGLSTQYPAHLMIVGAAGSGKSTLLNALHNKTKEHNPLFSGVSSTMKDLVPSFKFVPPRKGYLSESFRFAFLDELLRCIMRTNVVGGGDSNEELAIMNDLYEHQKRRAGSGVSSTNLNMTARILATTNPVRGVHNVTDLLKKFDKSWLSRQLIYYQPSTHVNMIQEVNETDLKFQEYIISDDDFVSIIDYLHSFKAEFDMNKINEIYKEVIPVLNPDLLDHYNARHKHHIQCIMDGIIKTRCLFEKSNRFIAITEDYNLLRQIWHNLIASWVDTTNIESLPIECRVHYLPENAQYLFEEICGMKRPVLKQEAESLVSGELSKQAYISAMMILIRSKLVLERDFDFVPYYMKGDLNG